jgi:hypothetical protein
LYYKIPRLEDELPRQAEELEVLKNKLDEADKLREQLKSDYRQTVADCLSKERENTELTSALAHLIKENQQFKIQFQTFLSL